jgi:hypothetical protein
MKRTIALIFALLLVFALAGVASAGKVPTPESLEGGKIVSAEETKALVGNSGVHFFDMRKPINYGKGHIPGQRTRTPPSSSTATAPRDGSPTRHRRQP